MIQIEQKLCLNPDCPQPSNRQFNIQNPLHSQCQGWIINNINEFFSPPHITTQFSSKTLNFYSQPLSSIKTFESLQNWPNFYTDFINNFKKALFSKLDTLYEMKIQQFTQLKGFLSLSLKQIKNYLQNPNPSTQLFQLLRSVQNIGQFHLNNKEEVIQIFDNELVPNIVNITNKMQDLSSLENASNYKEMKAIQQTTNFLNSKSIHVNQKIQKLTSIFKENMVKISQASQEKWKTQCWICPKVIFSENKKNQVLQHLLNHVYEEHQQLIYSHYMTKVLKYDVEEIFLPTLVAQLKYKSYEKVYIIDRQNAGNFQKPFDNEPFIYYVEVVNKLNANLAKGKYLTASSQKKDAADILIIIIICEILKINKAHVILITGDHFGKVLYEVINFYYPSRFSSIQRNEFSQLI